MSAENARIGARLRATRKARGLVVADLAERFRDVAPERIATRLPKLRDIERIIRGHEAGEHAVGPRYRLLWAAALEVPEDELFRESEQAEPSAAEQMPPGDLQAVLAAVTGRQMGSSIVADLAARVHGLRLADDVLAGRDLINPAFRELDSALRIYRNTAHGERTGRKLLSVIGEFAQIAGWVASDAGQHERAATTYRLGIDAAREAGDGPLVSNLLGSLAYQTTNIGDPGQGVQLACEALKAAGPDAPPRARALAWDRIAWAHARAQDAQKAMTALGEARDALDQDDGGGGDPGYLYWVDHGELQVMEARAYTELRRPLRAVPLLVDVLSRYDVTHSRELSLYLSWLAVALTDANEPEQAADVAARMLELSADVASDRTDRRAAVVRARFAQYRDVPAVRKLLDRWDERP
ncbi:transcriptional regulator [Actinomadura spongiicola]|uniref:Transcriptional regulator n=1 Tax=Actinomadura spongiicola TaxID=2303421 RepID=A0A372GA86_9ACTN|nr:transcriptional regulator [Actinomadura spongiicola]RFS82285.1 transcriptional regulator [Actinomadura spongiicola]